MKNLCALIGLLFVFLIVATFLHPALQLLQTSNALSDAEAQLHDAERQATRLSHEFAICPQETRAGFEQIKELVLVRLEVFQAAKAARDEARQRFNEKLTRWLRLSID